MLTACSGGSSNNDNPTIETPSATPSTTASAPSPTPSHSSPHAIERPQASTHVTAAPAPTHRATTAAKPAPDLLVYHLNGVGNAQQVISVTNSGYGSTYATLRAFEKTSSGWRQVFGPWSARIGYNGFAPPGEKREGDGRTPSGSYG